MVLQCLNYRSEDEDTVGSCSIARHVITFNFYLIKARTPYIDYVVLHELVHFLYPNHSKQVLMPFSNYMPGLERT